MRLVALCLGAMLVADAAWAIDRPIDATKLAMKRNASGRKTLSFLSKDPAFPFPTVGSVDNPATGIPGGVVIELFSGGEGRGTISVPVGVGKPGWQVKPGVISYYKYTNSFAPGGPSLAKALMLRQGRQFKLTAKDVPLPLAASQQRVGIRITMGSLRACAIFLTPTIDKDEPGKFVGKYAQSISLPNCDDATLESPPGVCGGQATFDVIQQRIFSTRGCNVGSCHGPFATADLDLSPGASYTQLVDVPANNTVANAAGKKRVLPFNAAASFLSQKLHGTQDSQAGEGSRMPLIGPPLPAEELDVIDAWIDAGAPQTGEVAGAPCLPPLSYTPAPSLDPPPGGYQMVLVGPTLQPGQEQEGCMWVPVPNGADFDVGKWEYSLNPGTHHFAIFEYQGSGTPPNLNVWRANDFACISGANFGNNITGSPQSPYFVDALPPGVARRLVAGRYLGLNAHYYNQFTVPIQIKVWINIYPYTGQTPKIASTIIDIDDTLSINVPPFTAQVHPPAANPRARYTNTGTLPRNVFYLGGHMHFRGVRFTVWASNGTKLYESFDWAHPNSRVFTPGFVLAPGDYFEYECLYDNGVTRPVRTDAGGAPTNLVFGVSAEDAMCIVTGSYYE
jgi:hypothetical protein